MTPLPKIQGSHVFIRVVPDKPAFIERDFNREVGEYFTESIDEHCPVRFHYANTFIYPFFTPSHIFSEFSPVYIITEVLADIIRGVNDDNIAGLTWKFS